MSTSALGAPRSGDATPTGYPYSWSPGTTFSIVEFVAKYKPSMVQNDGTKPWIWVRRKENAEAPSAENEAAAVVEATALLQQVTERVEQIKNDESIPMRGSKKTGTQSKKEVREQVQTEAAERLKEMSRTRGFTCGKWLIFTPADKVDVIWGKIASSLASGPLSSTSAFCAKVSTSPEYLTPGYQHLICIYIPDVYDKEDVITVMKVLLRQHGLNLSGVKSDLYTTIGLDSKHPSGIPSTVWKNASLLKESEIKELKDAYYAELSSSKIKTETVATAELFKDSKPVKGKFKPLVKKKALDDPFASGDESDFSKNEVSADMGRKRKGDSVSGAGPNRSPVKRMKT